MNQDKLPIEFISEVAHLLPAVVLQDVDKRMMDWKASGGKDDDPYMEQQARFVKNYLNARGIEYDG